MSIQLKLAAPCQGYSPLKRDPATCNTCLWSWGSHAPAVRSVFARISSQTILSIIEHRWSYISQLPRAEHCNTYRPIKYGEDLSVCTCGRFQHEHNIRVQVRYKESLKMEAKAEESSLSHVRDDMSYPSGSNQCRSSLQVKPGMWIMCLDKSGHYPGTDHYHEDSKTKTTWKHTGEQTIINKKDGVKSAPIIWPCSGFQPQVDNPGTCRNCAHQYITHPEKARGFDLEELTDLHAPNCKSVIMNGQHYCNCMTDQAKQKLLDSMKKGKSGCSKFTPRMGLTQSEIWCECGARFYDHTAAARENFGTWTEFRAAHMTNQEVIRWFMDLGMDDESRMQKFVHHMDHPSHMDAYAPPPKLIKLMWELLPEALQKLGRKQKKDAKSNNLPIDPDIERDITVNSEGRKVCYSCGAVLELTEEIICHGCVSLNMVGGSVGDTSALGTRQMMSLKGPAVVGSKLSTDRREVPTESEAEDHED